MTDHDITSRRFGPDHERECRRPQVVTCTQWKCQMANTCQFDPRWAGDYQAAMDARRCGNNVDSRP